MTNNYYMSDKDFSTNYKDNKSSPNAFNLF